jgi:hypothetical protein
MNEISRDEESQGGVGAVVIPEPVPKRRGGDEWFISSSPFKLPSLPLTNKK